MVREPRRFGGRPGRQALRALLVDDSPNDRLLVERALARTLPLSQVVGVGRPTELDEALADPRPVDILVTDYELGWGNGLDVLRESRKRWPDVAAVMFTGTGNEQVAVQAMKEGLDDYIVKSARHVERLPGAVEGALERRRRIRMVREVDGEVRELMDRIPAGIYRSTPDGQFLYGNEHLAELLGFESVDRMIDSSVWDLFPDTGRRERLLQNLLQDGVARTEMPLITADGREIWVRDRARLLRSPSGEPRFIEGVMEDVTERHLSARRVREQARHMELLQAVTAVANETVELRPALGMASDILSEKTGWPVVHAYELDPDEERLVSAPYWAYGDIAPLPLLEAASEKTAFAPREGLVGRVFADLDPEWIEDLRVADQPFIRMEAALHSDLRSAVAVPVVTGEEVVAVIELFHTEPQSEDAELLDILRQVGIQLGRVVERQRATEEQARLQRQAKQSQKMEAVGRLAGGIAHDFNNLLTVILMEGREARNMAKAAGPLDQSLDAIVEASERAARLTRQLLTFSRGRGSEEETFPLQEATLELIPMLDRLLGERHSLVHRIDERTTPVRMDRGEFEQVLLNLTVNARDAMPQGGKVSVELQRRTFSDRESGGEQEYAVLSVSDEGVGIPEEEVGSIFEPFFSTKDEGGTGLGLSICYGIVARAEGEIRVESEPGVGSTFRVLLPLADDPVDTEARRRRETPTGTETILVVEDQEEVRRVTVRALEMQGYRVLPASSGEEALDLLRDPGAGNFPDLIIADVDLPGMAGPEIHHHVRERHGVVPVLFVSGYEEDALLDRGLRAEPATDVLGKPFAVDELARRVRALLDGPEG